MTKEDIIEIIVNGEGITWEVNDITSYELPFLNLLLSEDKKKEIFQYFQDAPKDGLKEYVNHIHTLLKQKYADDELTNKFAYIYVNFLHQVDKHLLELIYIKCINS